MSKVIQNKLPVQISHEIVFKILRTSRVFSKKITIPIMYFRSQLPGHKEKVSQETKKEYKNIQERNLLYT